MVTPTAARKPYEEMRPALSAKGLTEHRENVKSEDVKPRERPAPRVSILANAAETRVATARILREAMSREEPRARSKIERLKILVNEKTIRFQYRSMCRETDQECKNSG